MPGYVTLVAAGDNTAGNICRPRPALEFTPASSTEDKAISLDFIVNDIDTPSDSPVRTRRAPYPHHTRPDITGTDGVYTLAGSTLAWRDGSRTSGPSYPWDGVDRTIIGNGNYHGKYSNENEARTVTGGGIVPSGGGSGVGSQDKPSPPNRSNRSAVRHYCRNCKKWLPAGTNDDDDNGNNAPHDPSHKISTSYRCTKCDRFCTNSQVLQKHYDNVHQPIRCPNCQIRFTGRHSLIRHIRKICGGSSYGCPK
ncbi:hypothetical protein BJ085DRAFT_29641 [Dimargaris cristalligena]|uniref:C2H2-type domain-containing protein n=1 Tax=Dimargaris cristalligena TaxID=215637 RepID=A0A4P9ZYW7_9FUNG|nr:hypothetical protein BJ085DRAFT_29641 [Dimargaris cristalligena]|eukprot:RKP38955.1 hypothetical protein BJ085DRAFT_29641 [Dimargaris cristalligena]